MPFILAAEDLIGFAKKKLGDHLTAVIMRLPEGYGTERADSVLQIISFAQR